MAEKFYRTLQFKRLSKEWNDKLEESGFMDIESPSGHLRSYDRRTLGFENRERIADFFTELEHYLERNPELQEHHRRTLELYCKGMKIKDIAQNVRRTSQWVLSIIRDYKREIF